MPKKKSSMKKSQKSGLVAGPPPGATTYLGPVRAPTFANQLSQVVMLIGYQTTLSSDGTGTINNVFSSGSVNSVNNWSYLAGAWDEFRVLAMEVEFIPWNRYNWGTKTLTAIATVVDQNDATTLTSINAATNYESCRFHSLSDPFKTQAHMAGTTDGSWKDTGSPSSNFWIKYYGANNSASTSFGTCHVVFRVQFRGSGG